MKNTGPIAVTASLILTLGIGIATTAGTSTSVADELTAVDAPLVSQSSGVYEGKWAIDGGALNESFEEDGVVISTGTTSLQPKLAADRIVSFGYVAGYGSPTTGENYAQLSGQAGDGVTAVRVVSASGIVTPASLVNGIWGAVWRAGDDVAEYGPATLQFDTAQGTTTVSTNDVDAIAASGDTADQR